MFLWWINKILSVSSIIVSLSAISRASASSDGSLAFHSNYYYFFLIFFLWQKDLTSRHIYELRHDTTNVLHMRKQRRRSAAKLISAFVFDTWIVHYFYFLKPKLLVSNHLQWLHSPFCVGPGRIPECWFSHDAAHRLPNCKATRA